MLAPFDLVTNAARLAALESMNVLDAPPDRNVDDAVAVARRVCRTPIALVSLVAEKRQWFRARSGLDLPETGIDESICAFVLGETDLLVIPDLTADSRTWDNVLVTGPQGFRFYAGAPLRTSEGHTLGSLCVIDTAPRPGGLDDAQAETLRALARLVVHQMELANAVAERDALLRERSHAEMRRYGLLTLGDYLRETSSVADMTYAASAILGQTLKVERVGYARLVDGETVASIEAAWTADGTELLPTRVPITVLGEVAGGEATGGRQLAIGCVDGDSPELASGVKAFVNTPVREKGRTVAILFVHAADAREWTPEALSFLRNAADRIGSGVARLDAETTQRLLNEELSHRMKNTLAMVSAIASQTLRTVEPRAAVESFAARIQALASAHDVLLQGSWSAASMVGVVAGVLATIDKPERFTVSGPDLSLGSRSSLSLSLLLHELGTNAVKHGALSVQGGTVLVEWKLVGENLVLTWSEHGGPPAEAPTRRGFGSRLLALGLVGSGGAELRFLPDGLQASFTAKRAELR